MVNTPMRCSSGSLIPPSGQCAAPARTKKYAESRAMNTIASVMMSTTMPHHAVE